MTRPLRYDDSFTTIINEKIHDKFLNIFTIKVQSTAFCQKLNLQRSLMITSLWDISFGFIIFLSFLKSINLTQENFLFFIESFILIVGMCFGFVGVDSATNLKKLNTKVYKNWRIFITFAFPVLELIHNFRFLCNYTSECSKGENVIFVIIITALNLYFTKIAWSFYIRLEKNHELLIIHGKYLEKMINDESYKLNDVKKYVPPEQLMQQKISPHHSNQDSELSVFKTPGVGK
jgi:hypothetical protein